MDETEQKSIRLITFDILPQARHFLPLPNNFQGFQWCDAMYITPALSSSFGLDDVTGSWYCNVGNIVVDLDGQLEIRCQQESMKSFDMQSLTIVSLTGKDLLIIGRQANSHINQIKTIKINGKTTPQKIKLDWFNLISLTLKTKDESEDEIDYSIGLISISLYNTDNK